MRQDCDVRKDKVDATENDEYRTDTGTGAGDKDSLAKQSGCVENRHR